MLRYLQPSFPQSIIIKPSNIISLLFSKNIRFLTCPTLNFASKSRIYTQNRTFNRRFSVKASTKSLVDDEAELSDLVSGLSTKNFLNTKLFSDSEDDGRSSSRVSEGRGRGRGGRGGRFSRGRGSAGYSSMDNTEDESDMDERGGGGRFSRGRGGRGGRGTRGRGRGGYSSMDNTEDDSDMDERGGGGYRGSRGGGRFERGSRGGGRFGAREEGRFEGGSRGGGRFDRGSRGGDRFEGGSRGGDRYEGGSRGGDRFEGGSRGGDRFEGSSRGGDRFEGRSRGGGRFEGGSRGGGRFGGRDSVSRFDRDTRGGRGMRGGERSYMGGGEVMREENVGREMRGGRSSRGRGGMRPEDKVRRRDSALSDGEGDNYGVMKRETRNIGRAGKRSDNPPVRGIELSDDSEDDEDEIDEDEEDETDEDEEDETDMDLEDELDEDEEDETDMDLEDELDEDEEDETDEEVDGDMVIKKSGMTWRQKEDTVKTSPPPSTSSSGDSYLTETRFDQCSVSPLLMRALKDAGYEKMTVVQEATLPVILKGKDVLAKARTGTGKTVAFLLPSIDVIEKTPATSRDQQRPPFIVLVICPTRELACQAAAEAKKLLKYHPSLGVQVVIGGTSLSKEQKMIQANPCQILVATPGRLKDHTENTTGFASRLTGVKVLILDEADHLLDMGFRKDIERIISAIPKQRQTLLFSATVPPEVKQICHIALKKDYEYVNTVQEGSEDTHTQVRQTHLVATLDNHFPLLYTLLKDHIADNVDYKVLVFCTTAMVTKLVAELLGELQLNVREIHSRKSQSYRTKVSDEFRKSKSLILVTSDVSARGVDYPDVTLVVQLGLPSDKQQYVHRLGRTGRKGKEGEGVLLLAPWEEFFLSSIKDIPITKASIPLVDPESIKKVEKAMSRVGVKERESAYQAWLGYYNSNKTVGRDKTRLVELANEFSGTMMLDHPPAIPKMILGKMGLKNVPGLRSK